jgi:6-pyruvoyltetrahydropterin/6-carboxytetrahydropterin synthase
MHEADPAPTGSEPRDEVLLTRRIRFAAAHRYCLPELSEAENWDRFGPCSYAHGHGHDYLVEVTLAGRIDPASGMVVNITELKALLEREVAGPLDGEYLTAEHPYLGGLQPGTEVLARRIWERIQAARGRAPSGWGRDAGGSPPAPRLHEVRVAEGRLLWSTCADGSAMDSTKGGGPVLTLTRCYEFAAAHRLHSLELSEAENRELFGKCNNPHGHGHNYLLEVTVGGEPDPHTGFLCDLAELDRVVHTEVVDRYDHRHLNLDLPEFARLNPTSENLVRVIWQRLQPALPTGLLRRVVVRETERNIFTYEGPEA